MAENDLTLDEVRRMARDLGMERFTDAHMEELRRATSLARARRASLKIGELTPADEPSHVFRAEEGR